MRSPAGAASFSHLVLWAVLAVARTCLAAPVTADLHRHQLDNGMEILVKEDHRAPVVASMVWYRAGSMDEVNGSTGVAHVLEHMMFRGTGSLAPGQFSRTIARAGGRDNASTGHDYTAYFQQLHRSQLPLALRLEADRMANLVFTEAEFAREVRVVMEERRLRTEDQPRSLLYESFLATAYQAHPYRTPIIGWMQDLENMTLADARTWYQTWYAPNNAALVVVGDVQAADVFAEAQRWFGGIARRALPERKAQSEAPQRGIRRAVLSAPAELPYLLMGWHVPALRDLGRDWEPYALWVLAAALGGSDASRLARDLVRQQRLALSADASYDPVKRGPALFVVSATPAKGHSAEALEAAVRAQIEAVAEHGITAEELERTRVQAVAAQVYRQDSVLGQARQIGMLHNAGLPPDGSALQVRRLQEVTAEQVQAVARKYFADDNLTVGTLRPQPLAAAARAGEIDATLREHR
ncbi:MAG TPA: pitrilysin family protein [Burkholderiales bacterium]|jgi:zinc protease